MMKLEHLKPMYEHFLEPIARMNALDLDAEDLAVVFPAQLGPRRYSHDNGIALPDHWGSRAPIESR